MSLTHSHGCHTARANRRERQRLAVVCEIKTVAREQLSVHGPGTLSMSRIARVMGLTTPALYRYFPNRDALITALILEAYEDLGAVTSSTLEAVSNSSFDARYMMFARTYRDWAKSRSHDYVLMHGATYPGYKAPVGQVVEASMGILRPFVMFLQDAQAAGRLQVPRSYAEGAASILHDADPTKLRAILSELPSYLVTLAFLVWLQIHGVVWEEINGHLPSALFEDGRFFEIQARAIGQMYGLVDVSGDAFIRLPNQA